MCISKGQALLRCGCRTQAALEPCEAARRTLRLCALYAIVPGPVIIHPDWPVHPPGTCPRSNELSASEEEDEEEKKAGGEEEEEEEEEEEKENEEEDKEVKQVEDADEDTTTMKHTRSSSPSQSDDDDDDDDTTTTTSSSDVLEKETYQTSSPAEHHHQEQGPADETGPDWSCCQCRKVDTGPGYGTGSQPCGSRRGSKCSHHRQCAECWAAV
ncbi:unnamed protein product [Discula destructiva]